MALGNYFYLKMISKLAPQYIFQKEHADFKGLETNQRHEIQTWISACFFGEFAAEQILKSFFGKNNSLEPSFFGLFDSLPFSLEEPKSWELWLDEFWVHRHSNTQEIFAKKRFFRLFGWLLWIYQLLWNTKFCFFQYHTWVSFNL